MPHQLRFGDASGEFDRLLDPARFVIGAGEHPAQARLRRVRDGRVFGADTVDEGMGESVAVGRGNFELEESGRVGG